jgi:hypothetical protein
MLLPASQHHLAVHDINFIKEVQKSISYLCETISQSVISNLNLKLDLLYQATAINGGKLNEGFVDMDQVCFLRSLGVKWSEIAKLIGVSRMTLYRKRKEAGIENDFQYSSLTHEQLKHILLIIRETLPFNGERMLLGYLRSHGVIVQRWKLRKAIHAIEPVATTLRWHPRVKRRPYSVPGPMSLWHLDGNHKIVRCRFIIYGAIDGYSRLVVYLKCSTDNKAKTVGHLFKNAIAQYGLPSRIRTDMGGGENMKAAEYMLQCRGLGRGSVIVGSSVHNQRIERLWRDVHDSVTRFYYQLFYSFEHAGVLNPLDDLHLASLHYIFTPRINVSLETFTNSWNNHPMSTVNGQSPLQVYSKGMLCLEHNGIPAVDYYAPVTEDTYGVEDIDSGISYEEFNSVEVPDTPFLNQLEVDPLQETTNNGLDLYLQALDYILNNNN